MATRLAARYVSRRFSSGGNILGEQEKAAENVLSKKMEQEKLGMLARKGQNAEATSASLGRGYEKTSGSAPTDKKKKKMISYADVVDIAAVLVGVGCYLNYD